MLRLVKSVGGYAQIVYFKYGQSATLVVGGGATPVASNTGGLLSSSIMIQPLVDVHFRVSTSGEAATTSDPIAWARADRILGIPNGQILSVIKAIGESDATVQVTMLEDGL